MLLTGCSQTHSLGTGSPTLIDPNAGPITQHLYQKLNEHAGDGVMFGHQATLDYGYRWTHAELHPGEIRSDVKDVSGSFPAVYGWDLSFLGNPDEVGEDGEDGDENSEYNESAVTRRAAMDRQLAWDRGTFERGGVLTYSWHMTHPGTGENFYDTTAVVHRLIPGGDLHTTLVSYLDLAADYFLELDPVPVIFRPWHEHNGDWFWWCKGSTSEEDFISLWRFTVEYLRDKRGVHNLIWAYSPDRSRIRMDHFEEDYHWGYPGDDYVDLIGLDNYWDVGHGANTTAPDEQLTQFRLSLEKTVQIAEKKGKPAALTETGLEAIPDPKWWTDVVLSSMLHSELTKKIAYFQVWRNATKARENRDHYYAPYPGQVSAENFVEFRNHPFVWFEDDLPALYPQDPESAEQAE